MSSHHEDQYIKEETIARKFFQDNPEANSWKGMYSFQRTDFKEKELKAAATSLTGLDGATEEEWHQLARNNGGATDYYAIPLHAKTLNDLIDFKAMLWNIANIFKACYRFGEKDTASKVYDLNKIIYYANRELARIKRYDSTAK